MRTHTFNVRDANGRRKRKYRVVADTHLDGYCHVPERGKVSYEIYVDPWLVMDRHLETAVHEAVHACLPREGEEWVGWLAGEVARFVWRLGYRLPGEDSE